MCGIFGVLGRDLTSSALENVFEALRHRGPDGRGVFKDEAAKLTLAHTRLAIIDLVTGAQPLQSDDGELTLTANGEIYGFEQIRSSLERKGYHFKTRSDSEVIIHLYREYGSEFMSHLRGEFAFLLYDRPNQLLIAARDRFGIKPLYFCRSPQGLLFASEMKAIFASELVVPKLNPVGLDPLSHGDPDHPAFPFEGIEHVPPGCYVSVDVATRSANLVRYWSNDVPAIVADPITEPADDKAAYYAASVLEELEDAVRLRLRADVPVGLYLSGGIDSAFVGALMSRNLDAPINSFSISFEGSDRSEHEFARRSAEIIGSTHHELAVTKDLLWKNLHECLWHSELPFVTLAPVGKFLLSQEARKSVTVVLTGEGADEVFLGYRSYFRNAIRDTRENDRSERGSSAQVRRLRLEGSGLLRKLSLLIFHKKSRSVLAASRAKAAHQPSTDKPVINAVQEARLAGMPLDILCYLGDREEMAHSLEARLPFLDHRLYEVAKWIPVDLKMRRGVEKAVLRDAAKAVLPDDLRLRPKSGFMLTSDAVDLFGSDRNTALELRRHLSKATFDRVQLFSYRTFRFLTLLARFPCWTKRLTRLRRNANKVIMYMMQVHMLDEMFITSPRWRTARAAEPAESTPSLALIS